MQQCVLQHYSKVAVTYQFTNRNTKMKFNFGAIDTIKAAVQNMCHIKLTNDEYEFLKSQNLFNVTYLEYLKNYRFKPEQVVITEADGDLSINITGPWHETILWEVPLMAIISESYFSHVDTEWDTETWDKDQLDLAFDKAAKLKTMKNMFSDFGTRRRRSFEVQDLIVSAFSDIQKRFDGLLPNFAGTSNVYFAMKYNIPVIGTFAHELVQGVSALEGLRYANRYTLQKWRETYKGKLGYALTDTFGTDAFFRDFCSNFARLYDGVRHDSGCPYKFVDKTVAHYNTLGIDPMTKKIIFSDGLNVEKALSISKYCDNKILCSFGIGTAFTSDFSNSPPLNMVIKLRTVAGIPVVKLSDSQGKEIGDADAVRVAKWTFFGTPLE